jgi:hypothetical protein
MGLLSSIGKFVTTNPVGKAIAKTLDVTTVALAHPIQTATAVVSKKSTVNDVITAHFAQSQKEQIKDIVLGTAGIAASVVGGAAIGGAAKAGTLAPKVATVAKALIPTTVKGKVIAAVAAPVVVGAVAKEPVKSFQTAVKAPGELAQFGGDVATFAADPSLTSAKQIIKESPLISAAAGLLVAGGAIKTIAPAIATTRQTEAIQEQTEAIRGGVYTTQPVQLVQTPSVAKVIEADGRTPMQPVTPQTQKASSGTAKKTKRRAKKAVIPSVNQRVNVIVSNRSTSIGMKNYLKREVLLN